MNRIARYGKLVAHQGHGPTVAEMLLAAADGLGDDPACELYLVNRQTDAPDTIWVTELWRSRADLDASIERVRGSADATAVLAHVEASEMIELDLLGGKGPAAAPVPDTDAG